jgi:hypothetical protein
MIEGRRRWRWSDHRALLFRATTPQDGAVRLIQVGALIGLILVVMSAYFVMFGYPTADRTGSLQVWLVVLSCC